MAHSPRPPRNTYIVQALDASYTQTFYEAAFSGLRLPLAMADALELSDDDDDFEQRPDARGTFRKPAPMVDRAMPDCAISGRQMQMPAAAPPSQRELPPSQPLMLSDLEAPEPEPPLQITQYSTHPSQPSQPSQPLESPSGRGEVGGRGGRAGGVRSGRHIPGPIGHLLAQSCRIAELSEGALMLSQTAEKMARTFKNTDALRELEKALGAQELSGSKPIQRLLLECAANPPRPLHAPLLCVQIKSIKYERGADAAVVVADQSGEMEGTLDMAALNAYPGAIKEGSALTLKDVGVLSLAPWCHHLLIVLRTVARVVSPGTSESSAAEVPNETAARNARYPNVFKSTVGADASAHSRFEVPEPTQQQQPEWPKRPLASFPTAPNKLEQPPQQQPPQPPQQPMMSEPSPIGPLQLEDAVSSAQQPTCAKRDAPDMFHPPPAPGATYVPPRPPQSFTSLRGAKKAKKGGRGSGGELGGELGGGAEGRPGGRPGGIVEAPLNKAPATAPCAPSDRAESLAELPARSVSAPHPPQPPISTPLTNPPLSRVAPRGTVDDLELDDDF